MAVNFAKLPELSSSVMSQMMQLSRPEQQQLICSPQKRCRQDWRG
jgi:hypothetical protein